MDNHSGDEIGDAAILKNVCESSGEIQNGVAVTVNDIRCEMEDGGGTAFIDDKFSGQEENSETDSACNVILSKSESISDETVTLFETDATAESDMQTNKYEEKEIESDVPSESVSLDCVQSTTLCDGVSSVNKKPAIPCLSGEATLVTDQNDEEYCGAKLDLVSQVENHCTSDTLHENDRPSKTTLIMLDDDEDEEERHERFLRIDTVEKTFGDGRNEAGEKMSALKRHMKTDNEGSTSSSTTSSTVVLPKNARLVFRNLPMDYTTKQMKELLQEKLPPNVLLGEFPAIIEGRAVVEVTPSNTAEQAARLLHDIMIGDCKISVRKLITVDTADTVPTSVSTPSSTATASIETVQATCDHDGCMSLVMQGDVHTQCCSHSICFATGVFDPANCPHCLSVHARAIAGELQARRLWRNRIQRIRKKRLQWVSEEVRLRFPHPEAPPRGSAVSDTGITESTGLAIQPFSSTTPTDGLTPDDSNSVGVEGGDDAKTSQSRVRDRSAERNKRAAEIAELGSLVVSSKLEMQGRSKGKEYRVTINNIAYGYCLKEMLKMLQDVAGPVMFLMPRFGSLVVEFETAEAATTCHQRLDKTTFMTRKLCITLHGEAGRGQQQQTIPTSPTAGDSSSNLKVLSAGEAVEPTQSADGGKLSTGMQARLSTAADTGVSTDNLVSLVAPTRVKDRLVMPNASTETFGFSSDVLETLNITLPIVKELSVSNLNERATSADVKELFNVAGCVMGVQYDRTRGTAVVEMRHPVEALQAISLLHAQFYHNKPLTVRLHRANETIPQGGTTPPFPKGLQTIGKRLSIDKKVMAALQAGLTTSLQPTRQRQQKMTAVEKRQQNKVPLPAKRPQTGGSVAQRNMNGSTPADTHQNFSMGKQQSNVMGHQQKISTTTLSNVSARPGGPQGPASGGCASFTPQKPDHARGGAFGQNNSAARGGDWSAKNRRGGGRRLKRQAGSETDFGNPAKRKNPYWGNYRGPNAAGNNAVNSVPNDSNFQNSAPSSGPKFSSNYGQGNNSGNNSNYGTLNRYTSSTSSSTPMGQQYSSSGTSNDWNTGNSSPWNENYSNWNWQQPNTGDTAAYGGGGSNTTTADYGRTAPGYSDNTPTGSYSAANASYAAGAARSYSNTTSNNIATASYGGSSSSAPPARYGGSMAPATASYSSSANSGYGADGLSSSYSNAPPGGSGAYSSGSGYYDSSGAPEAIGTGGAQSTAWAGQPTAKVPKYNSDGSFAGFS